jgi:hypothetical protein
MYMQNRPQVSVPHPKPDVDSSSCVSSDDDCDVAATSRRRAVHRLAPNKSTLNHRATPKPVTVIKSSIAASQMR